MIMVLGFEKYCVIVEFWGLLMVYVGCFFMNCCWWVGDCGGCEVVSGKD